LVRANYPDLSAAEVVQRLTRTAIDKGDKGRDDYYGNGQLDLVVALTAPQPAASSAPAVTEAPAAAPAQAADKNNSGGFPPLAIIAAGVVILAGAVLAVIFAIRRSNASR
jgi:hypothetical protein